MVQQTVEENNLKEIKEEKKGVPALPEVVVDKEHRDMLTKETP